MDDLTGINWSSSSKSNSAPPQQQQKLSGSTAPTNAFANLSLKSSPLSSRNASPAPNGKSNTGSDSFSNLTPFGRGKQNQNLSLAEQQRILEEQRRKDVEEKRKKLDALFGGGGSGLDSLGGTPQPPPPPPPPPPAYAAVSKTAAPADEDDLFAAFNSAAPVDNSSHYPPPTATSTKSPPIKDNANTASEFDVLGEVRGRPTQQSYPSSMDPFENPPLRKPSPFTAQQQPTPQTQDDDFDILGDLARPVSEIPRPQPTPSPRPMSERQPSPAGQAPDPRDPAIAEIMDMGFTAEQARKALAETDSGLDVEGAVSWLLEDAHRKSRPTSSNTQRSSSQQGSSARRRDESGSRTRRPREEANPTPAWARGKQEGEKDVAAMAADIGGTLFKSANSLWSAGKKKVEKAVAEFQTDMADGGGGGGGGGDPNMPKWMRERQIREQLEARGAKGISRHDRPTIDEKPRPEKQSVSEPEITDEAMMLEMGSGPPAPRNRKQKGRTTAGPGGSSIGRDEPRPDARTQREEQMRRQQAMEAAIREKEQAMREREMRARAAASAIPDSASRKAKLAAENEAMPQYVSSKRRRPPPASSASASSKPSTSEPDLLNGGGSGGGSSSSSSNNNNNNNNPFARDAAAGRFLDSNPPTSHSAPPPTRTKGPAVPAPIRRTAPPSRPAVPLPSSALATSNAARQKGTEAFRRGDYGAAQEHYAASLAAIPEPHLLRIILLANRSLCTFKLGAPKQALVDVEAMLQQIGESRGAGETIALDGVQKDMKEYWGKAVTRKAECLEQLEKWAEARDTWGLAIAAGVGGAVANAGKRRCEAALKPKPAPTSKPKPKPGRAAAAAAPPPPRPKAVTTNSGAVRALRQANADSERVEAEKLALHDVVADRVDRWKSGKEGNLRALIAGLDTVLWEGSGWKKVGMAELLMPNKVKIHYMKGIAKVHPDKIRPDATTEQRMISAAVFSLLNDSWDKFKAENGL